MVDALDPLVTAPPAGNTVDRVRRLFEFIKRLEDKRTGIRRNLDEVEWSLRLSELPEHAVIRRDASDCVVAIGRPTLADCPSAPAVLFAWLTPDWQDPSVAHAFSQPIIDPMVVDIANAWLQQRSEWARAEQPARRALAVFEWALALWAQLQREGDGLRIFWGDAHLVWQPDGGERIAHPLLLRELEVQFDEKRGEVLFVESIKSATFYGDVLTTVGTMDVERRKVCRDVVMQAIDASDANPFAAATLDTILRQIAPLLGASEPVYPDDVELLADEEPKLQRQPVIFVVPPLRGFSAICDAFLEKLPQLTPLPAGLRLVAGVGAPILPDNGTPTELYFTKPANEEQERIAQRIAKTPAVLVQGPPGTGKTHTIANLIGHFLAQGKSVLVTAHSSKSLRVLRDQVAPALQSLCVSLLDSDLQSRAELEHAINGIVAHLSTDGRIYEEHAVSLGVERQRLQAEIVLAQQALRRAVTCEIEPVMAAGRSFSPTDAAKRLAAAGTTHDWLSGPLLGGATRGPTTLDIVTLYGLNATLDARDEASVAQGLPDSDRLLSAATFAASVAALKSPPPAAPAYMDARRLAQATPAALLSLRQVSKNVSDTLQAQPAWYWACINASLRGGPHSQPWIALLSTIRAATVSIAEAVNYLTMYTVRLPEGHDAAALSQIANQMLDHVQAGNTFSRFALVRHGAWQQLLRTVQVNNLPPKSAADIKAIICACEIGVQRLRLTVLWNAVAAAAGFALPAASREAPEQFADAHSGKIAEALAWPERTLAPLTAALVSVGVDWPTLLNQTIAEPPYAEMNRVVCCLQQTIIPGLNTRLQWLERNQILVGLQSLHKYLDAEMATATSQALAIAVAQRDVTAYAQGLQNIERLRILAPAMQRRVELIYALAQMAPVWAEAIRTRAPQHQGPQVPGDVNAAWVHRQLSQELNARAELDAQQSQEALARLQFHVQEVTSRLAEALAWGAQSRRTSPFQHRALMSWLDLLKRIGKGTGKRAGDYMVEAQKQLDVAKGAVPVWIMPLTRLVESFVPGETRFDVVILDEASQCDLRALFAYALADRVIVVGDDEQVSPVDIGHKSEDVELLQNEWLHGFKDRHLFDGRASAYELARRSFPDGLIRLKEHFRCVPDIIAFSNQLSYGGEIKPLREASAAHVFPAMVSHRVQNGQRSTSGKINRHEALEVAALVTAVTHMPEYAGMELGVISLLGDDQAVLIDALLQRFMEAGEYKLRRVICGRSAELQGDERDVIFLSMVDSAGDLPLRLVETDDVKKRYNVAASRARDQLWVVHSLDYEHDLKPGDLRRRLLEHAAAPTAWRHAQTVVEPIDHDFCQQVQRRLQHAGYRVAAQVEVGSCTVDLVVEGASRRIALACDGDSYRSIADLDKALAQQALLERLGWTFVRLRATAFWRDPDATLRLLFQRLSELGITPVGQKDASHASDESETLVYRVRQQASVLRRRWVQRFGSTEKLFATLTPYALRKS